MANKYANQIYEAIDILTDQKLRNLKLDCTVQAIVKDNTNASKGYYTIEIQDANQNQQIIARSNRIDYVYPLNSCVYVTIPQNNSALDKWILGSVEVETSELDAYYLEEENPVQSGAEEDTFDGALALAQLIGGGDMLIIDFKVKDSEASGDGDGKLSFKGALKVGDTELVPVELNEDNIEGDPYFVDDTQRFTYKIPAHEYEITDEISFEVISAIDIEIDKIYIGKSDNKPFTKLLTVKLLNTADPPQPQEKIVFNFAADAIQRLQLQAYYNGVAIENNVTYSWAFDDTTMNHVISGSVTSKNATFSRNELWRDGTFNFTAAITYDGERVPITSSVSSINFPIVSISQSTAGETTTLTANLMVGSDIKENPWGGRTKLTYLWNDGSTTPFITRPKLKSGDSQNYTCTVKQQGIEIGSGNSVVIPQPEAAAQGVIAIINGNALLVWDESNTFKNDEIVLSATIYDVNGKEVCSTADDGTEKPVTGDNGWLDSITWIVHANELYKVKDNTGTNQPTLTIVAKGDFNLDIEVPQIEVTLTIKEDKFHRYYPDRELKDYTNLYAITEFTATQQGMPGTNGSKYIVKPLVDYATVTQDLVDFSVECKTPVVNFAGGSDVGYYLELKYQLFANDISKQYLLSKYDTLYFQIEDTSALDQFYDGSISLTEALFNSEQTLYTSIKYDEILWDPTETNYLENVSITIKLKSSIDSSIDVDFDRGEVYQYNLQINGDTKGSYDISNYTSSGSGYIENWTWNDSYSIQEYGFLAAAAPYIRVKPRVWDVELKQWLPEEGLSYSTQLMYTRNPEGISKVVNTNEYHLTVTSVDFNTTNIIRLTVMLDGKKFTTYLPLVIGTEETTKEKFAECLDHPFFYVMYDSTSTVPFYRYKQNAQSLWIKSNCNYEIAFNYDPAPKYLISSSGVLGVKVNDQKIFTNDGENENFALTSLTSAFYVPILFANVTSLYDFVGEWDGESAQIGEDYVISPIAAFGDKNENNKFTGLVLGQSKGADSWNQTFTLHHLRFTNSLETYGAWLVGEDSGTIVPFTPKKTHIIPVTTAYNADQNQEIDLTRFGNPYIVLSAGVEYGTSGDTNKPTRWFKLYGIDWDALLNTEIEIQNAEIYWGNHIYTYTITETNDVLGMVAYHNNERTFELDANTGKLSVGKTGKGQIVIDPTENNAVIYGGDYKSRATYSEDSTEGSGMMINLTEPGIYWGNGKFSVDKNGALKSTSGEIGGFTIVDDALYSRNSDYSIGMSPHGGTKWAFWAKSADGTENDLTGNKAEFRVSQTGQIFACGGGQIGCLKIDTSDPNPDNHYLKTVDDNLIINPTGIYLKNTGVGLFYNSTANEVRLWDYNTNLRIGVGDDSHSSYLLFRSTEGTITQNAYLKISASVSYYHADNLLYSTRKFIINAKTTTWDNPMDTTVKIPIHAYWMNGMDIEDAWFDNKNIEQNYGDSMYKLSYNGETYSKQYARANTAQRLVIVIGEWKANGQTTLNNYIKTLSNTTSQILYGNDVVNYIQNASGTPDGSCGIFISARLNELSETINALIIPAPYDVDGFALISNRCAFSGKTYGGTLHLNTNLLPSSSSTYNIGTSQLRWNDIWVNNINGSSPNNTNSDRNLKNTITPLSSQYLSLIDKLTPVSYKYNDGSSGRIHTGMIAQDVEDAMAEVGLTSQDFAGLVIREMGTENQTYALRYEEFIAPMIGKIQQQDKEISDLKSEIQELKTLISQLRGQEG